MASKTTNYGLHKFDLTDSPPDITAINDSMDIVDSKLKELSDKNENTVKKDDYTANDILTKLKDVDGKNSGLDADKFKGNDIIPVENGGTGATDANGAFVNLGQRAVMGSNTEVNSPNQAGCYAANGWRQIAAANDIPGISNYGILDNKYVNGNFMQMFMCNNSYGDYGFYVRAATDSTDIKNLEWQRVYTSRNAASLIQNLLKGGDISVVKSVQHKSGIMPGDVKTLDITISSVNSSKSFISFSANGNGTSAGFIQVGVFKNNTTITLTRIDSGSSNWTCSYAFDVVEFY